MKVYLVEQCIDGHLCSGEICARDWYHAEMLASLFGARVMGEAKGALCAGCGAVEIVEEPYDPSFFDHAVDIDA